MADFDIDAQTKSRSLADLADQDSFSILKSFKGGNHEAALIFGEKEHREAYVKAYGYERAIDVLNGMLENNKAAKTGGKKSILTKSGYEDLEDYRNELLSRQGY